MTPTLVHRYAFPIRDAIEALLGDAVGDCEAWRIRIEGDEVVIDVIAPAPGIAPTVDELASLPSNEAAKISTQDPEPELKGGPLSRHAAMLCDNAGFRTFIGVADKDAAKADILRRCGITSRRYLDHDPRATDIWREIERKYSLWKDGFDVDLD